MLSLINGRHVTIGLMTRCARRLLGFALLAAISLPAEVRSLTILHTNDLHARLSPLDNGHGGFVALGAVIQRERAGCQDCLLLNAGDLVQGTPVSTIFQGLPVYQIANLFHFNAATLGNHEFDYGWMQVRKFIQTANYPMVSANVVGGKGQLLTNQPYVILKVNGLRIGIIGAMTDDLRNLTTPDSLREWHTVPVFETARRYAAELQGRTDLLILLGHITAEEEMHFLNDAPEIPVLVTGHIHSGLAEAVTRNGRILVRVKGYGEELGRLQLQVDTVKKAPVSWVWKRIPVDPAPAGAVPEIAAQVKHWESEVSGRVDVPLAIARHAFVPAAVKILVEQAMREETGADFAWINSGGVRDGLPQGQLLVRHIWDIMPFDNRIVFGKVKGRDLPAVVVGNRAVEPDRLYTLAVTDFTAANQSAPSELQSKGLVFTGDGGLLRDVLVDWFRKKKVIE
jgi:5'-nucleotidase / UDP-sugar diphosphatase